MPRFSPVATPYHMTWAAVRCWRKGPSQSTRPVHRRPFGHAEHTPWSQRGKEGGGKTKVPVNWPQSVTSDEWGRLVPPGKDDYQMAAHSPRNTGLARSREWGDRLRGLALLPAVRCYWLIVHDVAGQAVDTNKVNKRVFFFFTLSTIHRAKWEQPESETENIPCWFEWINSE